MGCARHTPLRANVLASLCSEHFLKTCAARGVREGSVSPDREKGASRECDDHRRALDSEIAGVAHWIPRQSLSRANVIDHRGNDVRHLLSRRDASRARSRARKRVVGSFARGVESDRDREKDARRNGFGRSYRAPP